MLVSVIIPALNEIENIRTTIDAARRDYPPDDVEIIVVDGGSTDGTPDALPSDVTLLHSPRGRAVAGAATTTTAKSRATAEHSPRPSLAPAAVGRSPSGTLRRCWASRQTTCLPLLLMPAIR